MVRDTAYQLVLEFSPQCIIRVSGPSYDKSKDPSKILSSNFDESKDQIRQTFKSNQILGKSDHPQQAKTIQSMNQNTDRELTSAILLSFRCFMLQSLDGFASCSRVGQIPSALSRKSELPNGHQRTTQSTNPDDLRNISHRRHRWWRLWTGLCWSELIQIRCANSNVLLTINWNSGIFVIEIPVSICELAI